LTPTLTTRELILDTASALITREGIGKLTLDRVARDAGISKGGLLYHYSTKEQLIVDLVATLVARFKSWRIGRPPGQVGRREPLSKPRPMREQEPWKYCWPPFPAIPRC
jgi:AcrR family transcriptional regulator